MRNGEIPLQYMQCIANLKLQFLFSLSLYFLSLALSSFLSTGDCLTDPFGYSYCRWWAEMSATAAERLMRDLKRLQQGAPPGISGRPSDDDIMLWNTIIVGLGGTLSDRGEFKILDKVFGGESICLDMLDLNGTVITM